MIFLIRGLVVSLGVFFLLYASCSITLASLWRMGLNKKLSDSAPERPSAEVRAAGVARDIRRRGEVHDHVAMTDLDEVGQSRRRSRRRPD